MPDICKDFSTSALVKAIDENLIARSLSTAKAFQGEIYGPNPLWFTSSQNRNGVVRATFDSKDLNASIKATLKPLKAQEKPLTWWVGPTSEPEIELRRALQKHGLKHNRDMIGMAIDLEQLDLPDVAPKDLTVSLVEDIETFRQWYPVFARGFRLPTKAEGQLFETLAVTGLGDNATNMHYMGCSNGDVVATSTLFLGGGVAGLYNLTTKHEARERGIGAWMTVKTFHAARERGYRIGTLQTTYPNALRMYHRLGFEVYCKISIYQWEK